MIDFFSCNSSRDVRLDPDDVVRGVPGHGVLIMFVLFSNDFLRGCPSYRGHTQAQAKATFILAQPQLSFSGIPRRSRHVLRGNHVFFGPKHFRIKFESVKKGGPLFCPRCQGRFCSAHATSSHGTWQGFCRSWPRPRPGERLSRHGAGVATR